MVARLLLAMVSLAGSVLTRSAPSTDTGHAPKAPCTSWSGTVSGNDPSVAISGSLCEDAKGNVQGRLAWSSANSGSNVRSVEGAWSKDHSTLTMHDVEMVESKPKPGWKFCLVDEYNLSGGPDTLAGSYHSSSCHDEAKMTLAKSQ